jgi:hypothetical protein
MIPRPRRNRVTPEGEIQETPHRGALMGNRGDLHAVDGTLGSRRWNGRRWISCTLDPGGGPKVTFDTPGRYYPLFFHDELVALSAGHRPCGQCRRSEFNQFVAVWQAAHRCEGLVEIDAALHASRLEGRNQRRYEARLASLPEGVFVAAAKLGSPPMLLWQGRLYPWSHTGYSAPILADENQLVIVLTPEAIVGMLEAGYSARPRLDEKLANIDG